jgi:hypothetical protein
MTHCAFLCGKDHGNLMGRSRALPPAAADGIIAARLIVS